ncbi:hypothetical protein HYPSUDRAFT_203187 [Hypholoma sublateritium FD-334 SS-4]|uniref:Uncharacterized protein n=1 Tax=Hypholoma sublateritium (strain FD-334 SS-4) TaxID=945553 RepID=A0A0D2NR39_HYPSF|nr:hypothetical protein HYPSUDRAFT_203187 [Hypholoma sublateritium FD-334 SS-4]
MLMSSKSPLASPLITASIGAMVAIQELKHDAFSVTQRRERARANGHRRGAVPLSWGRGFQSASWLFLHALGTTWEDWILAFSSSGCW